MERRWCVVSSRALQPHYADALFLGVNAIDLARDIYRNATLEKVNFLYAATEREREMIRQMERWAKVFAVRCILSVLCSGVLTSVAGDGASGCRDSDFIEETSR